jgi:hypothetical protein
MSSVPTLDDNQLSRLNNSGQGSESLSTKKIVYNEVELTFCEQPPGKMIELVIAIGEAVKASGNIETIVGAYLPQLKGNFSNLAPIPSIEILMLVLQQQLPSPEISLPFQD